MKGGVGGGVERGLHLLNAWISAKSRSINLYEQMVNN